MTGSKKFLIKNKKRLFFCLLLLAVTSFVLFSVLRKNRQSGVVIHTPKQALRTTLANTDQLRTQGLSGKSSLGAQEAMLFIFDDESAPGIWMKDMKFAIDIVWLDSAKKVVSLKQNASPDSYPEVFYPSAPARYVVELRANHAQELGIGVGTTLEW